MVAAAATAGVLACSATAGAATAARVHIGDTQARVAAILGHNPVLCTAKDSNLCRTPVYLFLDGYVNGKAAGIGIQFRRVKGVERVSRVFRFTAASR